MILSILRGTPPWVFVVFAYLVWMGIARLRSGVRSVARIAITPVLFIVWGLSGLFAHGAVGPSVLFWLAGGAVGAALGLAFVQPLQADRRHRLVLQPGSVVPLLRNVVFFGAHYALNIAAVMHRESHDAILGWDLAVSGLSAGYFAGWAIRFLRSYRSAPTVDLAPRSVAVESMPH